MMLKAHLCHPFLCIQIPLMANEVLLNNKFKPRFKTILTEIICFHCEALIVSKFLFLWCVRYLL